VCRPARPGALRFGQVRSGLWRGHRGREPGIARRPARAARAGCRRTWRFCFASSRKPRAITWIPGPLLRWTGSCN